MRPRFLLAATAAIVVISCGGTPAPAGTPSVTVPAPTVGGPALPQVAPSAASPTGVPSAAPLAGSIVYHRDSNLDLLWEVWSACPDLSNARQLPTKVDHSVGWPAWSLDGSRIAFNADYDDPDPADDAEVWDIYTMDRDGGDVKKLTDSVGLEGDPSYSFDGALIAFDSTEPGKEGIWVMNAADGSGKRLVAPLPADTRNDYAPRFSPDGRQLVFTREVSDTEAALWIVNLDGSGLRRLTPATVHPEKAAWSHDGTAIVFAATTDGATFSMIWVVTPDGDGLSKVDTPPTDPRYADGYSNPVWSPDDSLIMMTHGVHDGGGPRMLGLAIVRPDGTDLRWAGDGTGFEKYPEWSAAPC